MSHRTLPVFNVTASHYSSSYRYYGSSWSPASYGRSFPSPSSPPLDSQQPRGKDAETQLFHALDDARFDQVRRAVVANPDVLRATRQDPNALRTPFTNSTNATSSAHMQKVNHLHVAHYALSKCQTWQALAQHCRRTGTYTAYGGDARTFRDRLTAMDAILSWILQHPALPPLPLPSRHSILRTKTTTMTTSATTGSNPSSPLHIALHCRLDTTAATLLTLYPALATWADTRGKTPLHVVCSLPADTTPTVAARMVNLLAAHGARGNVSDVDGSTPLHEVMRAAAIATGDSPARDGGSSGAAGVVGGVGGGGVQYGALMLRRRRRWRGGGEGGGGGGGGGSVGSCGGGVGVYGALDVMTPVVDVLLHHGARPCTRDVNGDTAMDVALRAGLDYIVPLQRAEQLRHMLCVQGTTRFHWRTPRACRNVADTICRTEKNGKEGGEDDSGCSGDEEGDCLVVDEGVRAMGALWGALPDDVVVKILSSLSPRDVMMGIGATCRELRRVATSETLWVYLDMSHCLDALRRSMARSSIARDGLPSSSSSSSSRSLRGAGL